MAVARARSIRSASTVEPEAWTPSWSSASVCPTDEAPSEMLFEALAKGSPGRLLEKMFSGELSNAHLALAAEVVGRLAPPFLSRSALLILLEEHASSTVREGCVLGLTALIRTDSEALEAVRRHADPRYEASAAVRETALESLTVLDD